MNSQTNNLFWNISDEYLTRGNNLEINGIRYYEESNKQFIKWDKPLQMDVYLIVYIKYILFI